MFDKQTRHIDYVPASKDLRKLSDQWFLDICSVNSLAG